MRCFLYVITKKKKKKTLNNVIITFVCAYNESQEILACANMDRELGHILGPNK